MSLNSQENHSARMIRSILDLKHEVSLFSKDVAYPVSAHVSEIDVDSGELTLQVYSHGRDIKSYVTDGTVSFDIEVKKDGSDSEIFNFERVNTRLTKRDTHHYELRCRLPDSVFVKEVRGAIRIPFILGMKARVNIEVYEDELSINARLRNLSVGGCMVDIPIEESAALATYQVLPGVFIEFPNGQSLHTRGSIRHMRPFGSAGHAAVGIQFIDTTPALEQELFYLVSESEREAAYLTGMKTKGGGASPLFIAGAKEKRILGKERTEREKASRQPPMVRGVSEVARRLQVILMFMNTREVFPDETVYDCADTLLFLVSQDRKQLLYALSFLGDEPEWVRHAVQVAATLADFLMARDPHAGMIREAVVGALLHTLGKPLLLSKSLPSLKATMTPSQKELLKTHVAVLSGKLASLGWRPGDVCRDILENCNERLDGSGYPAGKSGDALSDITRLVSLIKMVNKLTHPRNAIPPRTPLDAYRWVNEHPETFDKTLLVEYIQLYGLYPIGSLVKFSGGFLAWIVDVDAKGMPNRVQVVKNLSFPETAIDTVLSSSDFMQIGKLEGTVNPGDYGIRQRPGQP